jgi:hypothetical protein
MGAGRIEGCPHCPQSGQASAHGPHVPQPTRLSGQEAIPNRRSVPYGQAALSDQPLQPFHSRALEDSFQLDKRQLSSDHGHRHGNWTPEQPTLARGPTDRPVRARFTKDQTTENQRLQLERYAAAMGWTVGHVCSDRESGAKAARPGFKALLAAAARHEFDLVLVWSLDRF